MNSLADYFNVFSYYLKTGENEGISGFLEEDNNTEVISIYRNGFIKSCLSALKANYPSVVNLLGDDYFSQIAKKYIFEFPPMHASLIHYGEGFSDFLLSEITDLAYLKSFSLLDQCWSCSLHSKESDVWDIGRVNRMISEGVDLSQLPVTLVESAHVIHLDYNVFDTWIFLKNNNVLTQPIALSQEVQSILIWRCAGEVRVRVLEPLDRMILDTLKTGANLEVVTSNALKIESHFDVSTYFSELLQNRLLTLVS
ncbi:DNA-binding domain-containing protein [Marinomonas algicola]|uniref:HvfC/BufC N-terminal domain-containing protein n=1 Tax=Marinomonas algicola TaxID=2773454 RepID=UPI00174D5675|nr:DNA-binding domain-containing protein [Marinomonas algicola]